MNESEAMAVLVSAKQLSYGHREAALSRAGCALALLADAGAYRRELGEEGLAAVRTALSGADRLLNKLWMDGVKLLVRGAPGYPERLAHTAKPPHLLFVQGKADLCDPFPIAVVGTRRADNYGLRHTHALAKVLAEQGMCIVSGLALGVDACAHTGALTANGRTIAVLGSSLDRFYPEANLPLMRQILEGGGSVVSEYPPETPPTRYSFLQRNRIVAGLGLGVLVTQAPEKSGAQSTVRFALEEGREVFAMPGDIDRPGSALPNRLISEGARPVCCAQDVTRLLVIEPAGQGRRTAAVTRASSTPLSLDAPRASSEQTSAAVPTRTLDVREQTICHLLLMGEQSFDALSEQAGIASDELGSLLMMLELDGIVCALPGAMYRLA